LKNIGDVKIPRRIVEKGKIQGLAGYCDASKQA
jgi:hypothetical protein